MEKKKNGRKNRRENRRGKPCTVSDSCVDCRRQAESDRTRSGRPGLAGAALSAVSGVNGFEFRLSVINEVDTVPLEIANIRLTYSLSRRFFPARLFLYHSPHFQNQVEMVTVFGKREYIY